VDKALDGRTGLAMALENQYDLIALDLMLPGLNGMEVLRRIRQVSQVPVILLTARDSTMDKVAGLDGGADDYITKPFAIEELLARIRAIHRSRSRNAGEEPVRNEASIMAAGPVTLNAASREVLVSERAVELTKREFDLLCFLMRNKGLVLSRDTLLEKIWGYDYAGETNVVDVYVRYLRQKLEEPFGIKIIHTIRGVGYVVREEQDQ
jgi:Response regulators consisting of a CheY-like receiver domain and a winged-helix DNA-binding domain